MRVTTLECPDVNGDCVVGLSDFRALLDVWGVNPSHPADLDGDGVVGILDLLILLTRWGGSEYVLEVLSRS